jgi:putative NADPH-quinone reductase
LACSYDGCVTGDHEIARAALLWIKQSQEIRFSGITGSISMKVFVVFAHPEPKSFNGAMFHAAMETLMGEGHEVETSDLYQMDFDAVSGRHNFMTVKDPNYFKQQMEEMYATETDGFADDVETEIEKMEWCDLMIWQFPRHVHFVALP